MALQKQKLQISATGSLDTKSDEKNVIATDFLELENLLYTKSGGLSKRNGYEKYTKSVLDADDISNAQALTTFSDDELLLYSNDSLYTLSKAQDKWINKGNTAFGIVDNVPTLSSNNRCINLEFKTINNLSCYIYQQNSLNATLDKSVKFRIIDNNTNTIVSEGTVQTTATAPRVETLGSNFYLFYNQANVLKFKTISFMTPDVLSTATTVASLYGSVPLYFPKNMLNRIYIAYNDAINSSKILFINNSGASSGVNLTNGLSSVTTPFCFSLSEENGNVRVATTMTGQFIFQLFNPGLTYEVHTEQRISSTNGARTAFCIQDPNLVTQSLIIVSRNTTKSYYADVYSQIKGFTIDSTGTFGSSRLLFFGAMVIGEPKLVNGNIYFVAYTINNDTVNNQYSKLFVLDQYGNIVWTSLDDEYVKSFWISGAQQMLRTEVIGDAFYFPFVTYNTVFTDLNSQLIATNLSKFKIDFNKTRNYFDVMLGNNLHISGGVLKMYDSDKVVEHGFLQAPDKIPSIDSGAVSGHADPGLDVTKGYSYTYIYSWKDRFGQVHRSAPAIPTNVASGTLAAGAGASPFAYVTIRLKTLQLTNKENVVLEVYRTIGNGTIYYKINGTGLYSDELANDIERDFVSFVDSTYDGTLAEQEILYTEGGVLENNPAGSSVFPVSYKSRVFLIDSSGEGLQYSKLREEGGPVEFNANLRIKLNEFGGKAVVTAVMDDNLLIFKQRAIYAMTGEGPNNLGAQDDFRAPQLITTDTGCIDPNSLVRTPGGLMFKSEKGIYIIERALSVRYIGSWVERYNDLAITSATLLSDTNEIRFTTDSSDGRVLVYDYFHDKWTTFTNIAAVDSVVYDNTYVYARASGAVLKQDSSFSDDGSSIKTKIVSSWLQLAGIQGFQRFYKMLFLGTYKSLHKFKVSFAYNFDPSYKHSEVVDMADVLPITTYGTDIYGVETPYGGPHPLYQWEVRPTIQKCQAFKFKFEDFSEGNEGFSLSNFAAEVGIKQGLNKKSSGSTFGVS